MAAGLKLSFWNSFKLKIKGHRKFFNFEKSFENTFDYIMKPNDHIMGKLTSKVLSDPNSHEVCMILYLYSMEPFHSELQKASRNMDRSKIEMLGPFAMALYMVMINSNATE